MSQENVEIVRRANAAYAAGGMDAALPYFTDDTVVYSIPEWPDDPEYHGHDGLRRLDRQWRDNFDDFGFNAQELHDAGDAVVSLHELTGRTRASPIPMTMQIGAVVSEFADGRIGVQRLFASWESALEAAGLREQAVSQENSLTLQAQLKGWDPEAWRRGEFDLSFFDPEVTYEDSILPDSVGETYRGHEGIARATMRWIEPYETITIETERVVGDGDRLVSIHRFRGRARHTGIELEGPLAYVWTFRDGKVVHLKSFAEPEDALEAAGLSE